MHKALWVILLFGVVHVTALAQQDIEKLPESINTPGYDESSPVISRNGQRLFFTRTAHPDFETTFPTGEGTWSQLPKEGRYTEQLASIYSDLSGKNVTNPYASPYNQDVWYVDLKGETISPPQHPGHPLNNALPNSLVSTGIAADEYILLNEFYEDGTMYAGFSRILVSEDGHLTFPKPMHIYGFNLIRSDVNMTMVSNGHTLILSMPSPEREKQKDLFVSFYVRDNVWSLPIHMGNEINTGSNESAPFLSADKRFLYFASDRPGGKGGYDIYVSERMDYSWRRWSPPVPVAGVNSRADESQPYFDPMEEYLYFASRRDGSSDLFRQRLTPRPALQQPIVVKGNIIHSETGQSTRGEVFWGQSSASSYLEYFNSYDGKFVFTLTEYEPYQFQLRKPNHTAEVVTIDPREIERNGQDTVEVDFLITPVSPHFTKVFASNSDVITEKTTHVTSAPSLPEFFNIYFVRSKSVMLTRSSRALEDLWKTLTEHPALEIEITGHTDNIGDPISLESLSLERAEAVKSFLMARGIDPNRISVKGMGPRKPMYDNVSENNRQKNRRVDIRIIKS